MSHPSDIQKDAARWRLMVLYLTAQQEANLTRLLDEIQQGLLASLDEHPIADCNESLH